MVIKTELVTVREAARQCGKNPETIRRWIWSGKIPAEKLGNQLFIKTEDLRPHCSHVKASGEKDSGAEDWWVRAKALRGKLKKRGVIMSDSGEFIRQMREERAREF